MENLHFSKTKILDGFWSRYQNLVRNVTIQAIYEQFSETGRFVALECRKELESHVFWDSDVAKWIEAVAYLTHIHREPELERLADEAVELIVKNQLPNGYFNSFYIPQMPDKTFTYRNNHELYCAGHLIEAAIAYDAATGKDSLLKAMIRYADYIYHIFYTKKSAAFVTPGHEEIELALLKLAEYTGDNKYLQLASYFVEERGKHPQEVKAIAPNEAPNEDEYHLWLTQTKEPVREMTHAYGHTVRAGYLYTAMADLARQSGDKELLDVCKRLFRDIADTKLSITGGVGGQMFGEAYAPAYRLSNRENYNETCAAISLVMFAHALQRQENCREYADVIEQVLFNGMISGMSLEGNAFFYENALEIDLRDYDYSTRIFKPATHVDHHDRNIPDKRRLQRSKMFITSCCPPNISRTIASVARYMYSVDNDTIYCHQFAPTETELVIKGQKATIKLTTNYPSDGKLTFTYYGPNAKLAVRIPGWCEEYIGPTENGYAYFNVKNGCSVELVLPMEVHFVESNPKVSELAGKCAVTRGPIVYCLESLDNGSRLWDIILDETSAKKIVASQKYNVPTLEMKAFRRKETSSLYRLKRSDYDEFTAKLIPYFAFANRGICDMQVWTQVK